MRALPWSGCRKPVRSCAGCLGLPVRNNLSQSRVLLISIRREMRLDELPGVFDRVGERCLIDCRAKRVIVLLRKAHTAPTAGVEPRLLALSQKRRKLVERGKRTGHPASSRKALRIRRSLRRWSGSVRALRHGRAQVLQTKKVARPIPRPLNKSEERGGNNALDQPLALPRHPSLGGFGRDQLPVRIAGAGVALANVQISTTSLTFAGSPSTTSPFLSLGRRNQLAVDLDRYLGRDAFQRCFNDFRLVDADKGRFDVFPRGFSRSSMAVTKPS